MNRKKWSTPLLILLIVVLLSTNSCSLWPAQPLSIPEGDTLILFDTGPLTLDPAISQEVSSNTYIMQIFSGLVTFDQDLNPLPDIAESWEKSNNDTTYTFHLRQGVQFHNGEEVTAANFKYSWERACRPETKSPTAATYLSDIVGVKAMLAGEAEGIDGVKVIDNYTLQVTIDAPKAYFLAKLTYPVAFVVDKANVESGKEWWRKPNGSGPFKLKGWDRDKLIILERNELYYRDEYKAKVSYITFRLSGGESMQMYENGEIDATYVSLAYLERVTDETNPLHQELMEFPELSISYIAFNTAEPPFNNTEVRQAFCHAVDKARIVSQLLKDSVIQAEGILPLGMPGYNESVRGLDYDLDEALSLIDGTELHKLIFTDAGQGSYLSSWLMSILYQWEQNLGVEIEVRQLESEAYFYQLDEEKDEMFFFGWVADYPNPQNFLEVLFRSGNLNNYGSYDNPVVDSLLDQAAVASDTTTRFALYREAEQLIIDDAACLPLWFGKNYVLVKPYVKGYVLSSLGIPLLSEVSIEPH